MTRLTPERRAVVDHMADVGEASPSEIARALGRSAGSTRELLRAMVRDGLLANTSGRGIYSLPPDALTQEPDTLTQQPDAPDVSPDFEESPIGKTKPGQIFAWSEADGGMIPNETLLARKGRK